MSRRSRPRTNEIYNLGAQSFVGVFLGAAAATTQVNAIGTLNILDARGECAPGRAFTRRRSSEMFGLCRPRAGENHPVLSAQPLWRRQARRALVYGQLPRELRPARLVRASCSITSRRCAGSSSSHAKSLMQSRASSSASRRNFASANRCQARLGLRAGLRRSDVADAAAAEA